MNTTNPVRPELVEGLDLKAILDFESLSSAHWNLINTKSFKTNDPVQQLMLLYVLQINDLSRGLDVLRKPISNDGDVLQQSQWVLLRAMFEATIKLCYLCCDPKMTQTRFIELERDGLRDQLNNMKAMRVTFPHDEKADGAIALVETRFNQFQNIKALKMEERLNAVCGFYGDTELGDQLKIIWKRLCAVSHSRPSQLFQVFIGENRGFFEPFTKFKPDSANEVIFMAACFLSMTGKFLIALPDKNSLHDVLRLST